MMYQLEVLEHTSSTSNQNPNKKKKRKEIAELVLSHREAGRKVARSILRKWRANIPEDELNSMVDLALCEAAMRFDPEKGAQFLTFLFYHIRGHLIRWVTQARKDKTFKHAIKQLDEDVLQDLSITEDLVPQEALNSYFIDRKMQAEKLNPEKAVSLKQQIEVCKEARSKLGRQKQARNNKLASSRHEQARQKKKDRSSQLVLASSRELLLLLV